MSDEYLNEIVQDLEVIYIGPIGEKNKPQKGGYEAANRKNINKLVEKGINITEIPYPRINNKNVLGKFKYIKLLNICHILIINRKTNKNQIVHITPLYRHFIYFEYIILQISRLCGYKIVFDIRAGSFINNYNESSKIYKYIIRSSMKISSIITVEGASYIDFIKKVKISTPVYYFPNTALLKDYNEYRSDTEIINLIYFGQISKAKGINILLDLIKKLGPKYMLYLAGSIEDQFDYNLIKNNGVKYLGLLTAKELEQTLIKMHFFIFPTKHKGEGQSNSLIESMSFGVIPICSDNGFNKEVVNDCGIILPYDATYTDYFNSINEIVDNKNLSEISIKCKTHIKINHNLDTEISKLIILYHNLIISK